MTKKKPKKRLFIDWDSIEPLYRAGTLSLHQICAQYKADHINSQVWKITLTHGAILKHGKAKGWTRDLAGKVQKRIKEKLVTGSVTSGNMSEEEIVERVSEDGKNVIVLHREQIADLTIHENLLLKELKLVAKKIKSVKPEDIVLSDLKTKSNILKNIAHVRAQRIALERQAHNIIDDDDGTSDNKENLSSEEIARRLAFMLRQGAESNG